MREKTVTEPNRPTQKNDLPEEFELDHSLAHDSEEAPALDPTLTDTAGPYPINPLPNPNRRLGRTGPLWGALFLIVAVILVLILLLRGGDDTPATPAIQVTAGAPGGLILPTEAVEPTATPLPPTPTPIPVLEVGQTVRIANTDGEGIRLRADASTNSITYDIYRDGDLFTVVEPSSDYTGYPVEAEGYRWYRVRAEDGLVGWTVYEFLEPVSDE